MRRNDMLYQLTTVYNFLQLCSSIICSSETTLGTRNTYTLSHCTELGNRAFKYATPSAWNQL